MKLLTDVQLLCCLFLLNEKTTVMHRGHTGNSGNVCAPQLPWRNDGHITEISD